MEYNKARSGKWLDTAQLRNGMRAKITDECTKQDSQFKDEEGNAKTENIARVHFEGIQEPLNMRLNWTTIYGLIDAFGKESKDWIGKLLTVKTINALVAGKMRTMIYLVPEGFVLAAGEDGRLEIRSAVKEGRTEEDFEEKPPVDDINPDDIPF